MIQNWNVRFMWSSLLRPFSLMLSLCYDNNEASKMSVNFHMLNCDL
uniref:Uncharacterized protein n=1 Tax=Rhizophora mucronata TaxID=61149 RepID=A0A2P2NVW8_RHIMU